MKRDVPHFRIGLLLTEAGILAPKQLDEAIREGEQTGLPFLKVLVTSGDLRQHELQAVIRAQSLIWGGLLDVERAINALNLVHTSNISFDDGLQSVGWARPASMSAETIATAPYQKSQSKKAVPLNGNRFCQYCATNLPADSTLCPFCTADNAHRPDSSIIRLSALEEPPRVEKVKITAASPPRDPLCMAFFSGCCCPGMGQWIIGQKAKGITFAFIAIALAFLTGGVSSLALLPLAALDAYLVADKLRNGKSVGLWESL